MCTSHDSFPSLLASLYMVRNRRTEIVVLVQWSFFSFFLFLLLLLLFYADINRMSLSQATTFNTETNNNPSPPFLAVVRTPHIVWLRSKSPPSIKALQLLTQSAWIRLSSRQNWPKYGRISDTDQAERFKLRKPAAGTVQPLEVKTQLRVMRTWAVQTRHGVCVCMYVITEDAAAYLLRNSETCFTFQIIGWGLSYYS